MLGRWHRELENDGQAALRGQGKAGDKEMVPPDGSWRVSSMIHVIDCRVNKVI
jgi:hypothetical protein